MAYDAVRDQRKPDEKPTFRDSYTVDELFGDSAVNGVDKVPSGRLLAIPRDARTLILDP
jgi:hypothetical protein